MNGFLSASKSRRRSIIAGAAALLLLGAAVVFFALARSGDDSPTAAGDRSGPEHESEHLEEPGDDDGASRDDVVQGEVLEAAQPQSIEIDAIDVSSPLMDLGMEGDNTVEVPPYEEDSRAGWFTNSPSPGEQGPSIILGHVDSEEFGPAIFHDLAFLEAGDEITIDREDGTTAVFEVDRTVQYAKAEFPKLHIYGNIDHAGLRLITCGGTFDLDEGSYEDNVVTYATLVDSFPTDEA